MVIITERNTFNEIIGYRVGDVVFYGEAGKNYTFSQAYDRAMGFFLIGA